MSGLMQGRKIDGIMALFFRVGNRVVTVMTALDSALEPWEYTPGGVTADKFSRAVLHQRLNRWLC